MNSANATITHSIVNSPALSPEPHTPEKGLQKKTPVPLPDSTPILPRHNAQESSKQNQAAHIITRGIRQMLGEPSYLKLFKNEDEKASKTSEKTGHERMKALSKRNITMLMLSLKPLTPYEEAFFVHFLDQRFFCTHATTAVLEDEKGILSIYSNDKLIKRNIDFDNSSYTDIHALGNGGFVFLSLETGEKLQKLGSRFGRVFYRVPMSEILKTPCWMSLTEEFNTATPYTRKHLDFISPNECYLLFETRKVNQSRFYQHDILPGLALSIILKARILPESQRKRLLSIISPEEMNKVINGLFRPEVKVPLHLITPHFQKELILQNKVFNESLLYGRDEDSDKIEEFDEDDIIYLLQHISPELKNNRQAMLSVIDKNARALEYASDELKADRGIVMAAVQKSARTLRYASDSLKADREIVLVAVRQNAYVLEYADDALKADRHIVMEAVNNAGHSLAYASGALKADRDVVMAAVQKSGTALEYASEALKADRDIVMAAVQGDYYALQYASEALKSDRDIVMVAVRQHGCALDYASKALKADRDIVMIALEKDPYALQCASESLKADRDIVKMVIQRSPLALECASDSLKADHDIVLLALEKDQLSLRFASDSLKKDPEFVLKAIQTNVHALSYVSKALRADREFVMMAVQKNAGVLQYVSQALKKDPDVLMMAAKAPPPPSQKTTKEWQDLDPFFGEWG